MNQHKWAKEIKAWAAGDDIESRFYWSTDPEWYSDACPEWDNEDVIFRIKPTPKEPQYLYVYNGNHGIMLGIRKELDIDGIAYIGKIKLEEV